jgi:hypothetical protein
VVEQQQAVNGGRAGCARQPVEVLEPIL